jgi:hypothetical protein
VVSDAGTAFRLPPIAKIQLLEPDIAISAPGPRERGAGAGPQNAVALADPSSQPLHRHDVFGRRAGNDRVARPGVDWALKL